MARLRDLGAPRVVLTSAWQNQAAHALFRSLGFRETMIEMAKEMDGGSSTSSSLCGDGSGAKITA
jgi:RimJ/RimL family protein N-acetyltransferase